MDDQHFATCRILTLSMTAKVRHKLKVEKSTKLTEINPKVIALSTSIFCVFLDSKFDKQKVF